MTSTPTSRRGLRALITSAAAAALVASASPAFAGSLSDADYKEGFGANVTGGAGQPVCAVTSSATRGAGTFDACFDRNIGGSAGVTNRLIVFAVPSFQTDQRHVLGSNVTIDGCANGQNGVLYDQTNAGTKNALLIQDPVDNVIVRCLNFRGLGAPNAERSNPAIAEENFIWLDTEQGQTISNILIDRNTFYQATNKAFDITGSGGSGTVRNVSFQRNLVTDGALNTLIKYADCVNEIKYAISLHHNVYAHGGERQIAQVRDCEGQAGGPIDIVNNVAYLASNYYQSNYPDGTQVDPYTLRFWNTNAAAQASGNGRAGSPDTGDTTAGNVTANVVANAFLGDRAVLEVRTDTGASEAGIYIGADNLWSATGTGPDSNHYQGSRNASAPGTIGLPWHTPNAIAAAYQVTVLPVSQLASILPFVGAPNRVGNDQQRLDDVAAALGSSGSVPNPPPVGNPPPVPTPPPTASPPPAPGNLTVH